MSSFGSVNMLLPPTDIALFTISLFIVAYRSTTIVDHNYTMNLLCALGFSIIFSPYSEQNCFAVLK